MPQDGEKVDQKSTAEEHLPYSLEAGPHRGDGFVVLRGGTDPIGDIQQYF